MFFFSMGVSCCACIGNKVAEKSKPLPNNQKIILKPAIGIIFVHQIKVSIKHYNIRWY